MDPIAAYKAQQARNGLANQEKSIPQLREANPRWATIFDRMDISGDGLLQYAEVTRGFKQILGAGSQVPEHYLKDVFVEVDRESQGTGDLTFKDFCTLAQRVSAHMMDHPKWVQEEAALDAKDEKQRQEQEQARKKKEGPDIFAVLGLPRSKDLLEVEARKKKALSNASCTRQASFTNLGSAIVGSARPGSASGSVASGSGASGMTPVVPLGSRRASAPNMLTVGRAALGVGRFAAGLKRSQMSIESNVSAAPSCEMEDDEPEPESPTKKLREAWSRFSLSSARGRTQKALTNVRQIHLSESLPQVQALGKKNAGCCSLRFSPDGSQLAGGFFDGGVRIFDVDKSAQLHCMNLPKSKGGSVKSDEERERDAILKAREEAGEAVPAPMQLDDVSLSKAEIMKKWEPVSGVRWQPAGGRTSVLASVDTNGCLSLWDVPRCKENRPSRSLATVETGSSLACLTWSCDGSSLAVAGGEHVIKLYDVQEDMGKPVFTAGTRLGDTVAFCGKCTGHALKIVSLCAHPTSKEVLISAGLDKQILTWDIRTGTTPVAQFSGPELAGDSANISRDGHSLLVGSHRSKNPLEIYDLRMTAEARPTLSYAWLGNEQSSEGGGRWTTCLLFAACWDDFENKIIAAAGENENLARVYERSADEGEPLRIVGTMRGKEQAFWSSAISTDGQSVAFGSSDGAVCIMDVSRK